MPVTIGRRELLAALGGAAAAWPLAARAQRPAMPVIGYFSGRSPEAEAPIRVPFLKALEGSGFAVERNIAIEYRFAEGQDERLTGPCDRTRSPTGGDAGRHR
jgi:putative ABC transport system substrate-binding protein